MNAPWICGKCYHRNKAKHSTCVECGTERPKSKQEVRDAHRVSQVDAEALGKARRVEVRALW